MLRNRIIFSLIYYSGNFAQSRNFRLQKVGGLNWLLKNYHFEKIAFSLDELMVLNASRGEKNLEEYATMLSQLVERVFIPIAAGGGIRTMEHAKLLFDSGADKIVLNTLTVRDPEMIERLVSKYGSQSILAAVDFKLDNGVTKVYIKDGSELLDKSLEDHLVDIQKLGVGEIYLNSIDKDGTGFGYDMETIISLKDTITVPLIIAGGAGNQKHLIEGLDLEMVDAVATANLFNFVGDGLPKARQAMLSNGMNLANWEQT